MYYTDNDLWALFAWDLHLMTDEELQAMFDEVDQEMWIDELF